MTRDLNQTRRFGKIDRSIPNFRKEDRVDDGIMLEVLKDTHSFDLRSASVNVEFTEFLGVSLNVKSEKVSWAQRRREK